MNTRILIGSGLALTLIALPANLHANPIIVGPGVADSLGIAFFSLIFEALVVATLLRNYIPFGLKPVLIWTAITISTFVIFLSYWSLLFYYSNFNFLPIVGTGEIVVVVIETLMLKFIVSKMGGNVKQIRLLKALLFSFIANAASIVFAVGVYLLIGWIYFKILW